jgi:hypothetical protein
MKYGSNVIPDMARMRISLHVHHGITDLSCLVLEVRNQTGVACDGVQKVRQRYLQASMAKG